MGEPLFLVGSCEGEIDRVIQFIYIFRISRNYVLNALIRQNLLLKATPNSDQSNIPSRKYKNNHTHIIIKPMYFLVCLESKNTIIRLLTFLIYPSCAENGFLIATIYIIFSI